MIRVFVSWSGERSARMATAFSNWLPKVIQMIEPWMSDENIPKGELWSNFIRDNLRENHLGIVCVTPENYFAPWLLFEAGALSTIVGSTKVCPLLLGITPDDIEGPLREFQATVFDKDDMFRLMKTINESLGDLKLNEHILTESFEKFWPDLEAEVRDIANIEIEGTTSQVMSAVKALAKHGLPEPEVGAHAFFSSGFESHALYSTLTSITNHRLYVFGRKNRKLFDKEHKDFFTGIKSRIDQGFDFKALFLSPEAPSLIIEQAHQDSNFMMQLQMCIQNAQMVLRNYGLDPAEHCRVYKIERKYALMIADDAVLFSNLHFDDLGNVEPITKAPFNVINSKSIIGLEMVDHFLSAWENASPLSDLS
jgi:hypothetical protein